MATLTRSLAKWEPTEVLITQLLAEPEECQSSNQSSIQSSPADFLKVMDIKSYSNLQKLLALTALCITIMGVGI